MDAIDKMIAELDQEAQTKRERLAAAERARISETMARDWAKKESDLQLRAQQAKKQAEKIIIKRKIAKQVPLSSSKW